jgi:hypothetical protein
VTLSASCPCADLQQLEHDSLRLGRTQTYGNLDVPQFLRDVGIRGVGDTGGDWIYFRCPFHHDLHPSASMHRVRTTWTCHVCHCWGNAARLLSMLKDISTRQAYHRIMARTYDAQVDEPPSGYRRKTVDRASGSLRDMRIQTEHAIELLQKGARYNRAKDALMALYGISESTAKRRLKAATQYLDPQVQRFALGRREIEAMPFGVYNLDAEGKRYVAPLKRKVLWGDEIPQKPPSGAAVYGGHAKTRNLTPTRSRTRARRKNLPWPGQPWQKPRVVRAGLYYELADGRLVHETHRPQAEIDWLSTGSVTAVSDAEQ